jgi:hypothetical protein
MEEDTLVVEEAMALITTIVATVDIIAMAVVEWD